MPRTTDIDNWRTICIFFFKLKTYDEFRRKHGQNWLKISKTEYKTVFASGVLDLLDEKDKRGRRVLWLRAGKWIQKLHTADQCLKVKIFPKI